jgi:hypothetical protein
MFVAGDFSGGATVDGSCATAKEIKFPAIQLAIAKTKKKACRVDALSTNLRCRRKRRSKLQHLLGTSDSVSCGYKQTRENPQIDYAGSIIR